MSTWTSQIIADVPVRTVPTTDGGTRDLSLDLYLPIRDSDHPAGPGKPSLLVYIHGGGWAAGHNDRPPGYRTVLKRGLALASLQYRFSDQGSGDDMVDDVVSGIAVARKTARGFGCDVDRYFLWGVSAGGHLSSLVAHRLLADGDDSVEEAIVPPPRAVSSWCGPMDFGSYTLLDEVVEELRETVVEHTTALTGGDAGVARALSPKTYVGPGSPPHYFVHGAEDPLVPPSQSVEMHQALVSAGVRSEIFVVPGRGHDMPPEDSEEMHRTLDFLLARAGAKR